MKIALLGVAAIFAASFLIAPAAQANPGGCPPGTQLYPGGGPLGQCLFAPPGQTRTAQPVVVPGGGSQQYNTPLTQAIYQRQDVQMAGSAPTDSTDQ